jgi:oxygen-independent coproporphyrinogen-3 oxidase
MSCDKIFSLYIHVPFCASFCDYCDFYSEKKDLFSETEIKAFIKAVILDIKNQIEFFDIEKINTVYIGGGTPSVLGRHIRPLLDALNKIPCFSPVEFTLEVNPESADEDFLTACKDGGVNRLSVGVQSFFEPSRQAVNRHGRADMFKERLALTSKIFSGAFSADLICGLPYQTEKIVLQDINTLLFFEPAHVSFYSLSVEYGTPLENKVRNTAFQLPDKDETDDLWLAGRDALLKAGFFQYEVSNFALQEKQCLHNIRYWLMDSWIGAGPAASGTIIDEKTASAKRRTYPEDLNSYINITSTDLAFYEEIDKNSLLHETLLMGYRYHNGPDKEKFIRRFGLCIEDVIPETLTSWKNRDIMLFLNSFLCEAFCELDKKNIAL